MWQVRGVVASSVWAEKVTSGPSPVPVGLWRRAVPVTVSRVPPLTNTGSSAGSLPGVKANIARGRRHGEPGVVEIGEELLRGADYHLRIGHRGGQVCIYRAPGQHFDLLFGIIVRFAGSFRIGVAVGDRDGVGAHPEDGLALLELGERIPFLRARFARYRERESPGCGRFGRA